MTNYSLQVTCLQGPYLEEPCIRVLAIDPDSSLAELHLAIQRAVGFGNDHLYDFFTAHSTNRRAERRRICDSESWEEREDAYRRVRVGDIWPMGRRKLYYLFDFGDRWLFEIRRLARRSQDDAPGCPRVVEREGPDPVQYAGAREGREWSRISVNQKWGM